MVGQRIIFASCSTFNGGVVRVTACKPGGAATPDYAVPIPFGKLCFHNSTNCEMILVV